MARRDISRLCQAVLPEGFEQAKRQLPQIQGFLEENLPEAVRQSVTLLSVSDEQIVTLFGDRSNRDRRAKHPALQSSQTAPSAGIGNSLDRKALGIVPLHLHAPGGA